MHYHKLTSQLADCEVSGRWDFSTNLQCLQRPNRPRQAAATMTWSSSRDHASPTYPYYDYTAVRDRRGRTTRAGAADVPAALHRLMDTDVAIDDADAHIYTTTIIMHGEREAKTEDDDHSSLIGGPPVS